MTKTRKKKDSEPEKSEPEQQTLGVDPENLPEIEDPNPPVEQTDNQEATEPTDDAPPVEPEPTKRRPGRPSKTDPPVLRSGIIERINNLTSWDGTRVYCYRWEPFTDRKAGGKQSVMVKRYDGPFDEQDVLEDPGLGSGVYEFVVNRTDPQTRQRKIIDSGVVRLLNMKYPPRIPQKEWVDDERNKDWEWARNLCDKTEAPGAVKIAPAADPMLELYREQSRAQMDMLNRQQERMDRMQEEMRNKKDPAEQSVLTILLQKVLEKPAPPPPPPADPVRDMLMTYLMKQLEAKSEPVKQVDPEEALERALKLNEKIDALGGGKNSGRSRKTGWQELIADVAPSAAQVLTPFMQMLVVGMNRQQQQAGMPPLQLQQPSQPGQPELTEVQQQQPGPGVGPRPVEHRKQPTVEGFADKVLELLKQGADGYALGDWYVDEFGIDEMNDVREQGKPQILKDLRSCPNPWRFIAVYEESGALDKFLREFVTWEPSPEPEEDEEDEDAPRTVNDVRAKDVEAVDNMAAGWMQTQETV